MARKLLTGPGSDIAVIPHREQDYICLTDMTSNFGGSEVIKTWFRTRSTIEFLGVWESINNPQFNWVEFDPIKNASGNNTFVWLTGEPSLPDAGPSAVE